MSSAVAMSETIRIVDIRRTVLDVSSAPLEEIYVALEDVASSDPTLNSMQESVRAILSISERIQGDIGVFLEHLQALCCPKFSQGNSCCIRRTSR